MKTITYSLIALVLFSCGQNNKKKDSNSEAKTKVQSEIEITSEIEQLATDFKFTEGPAVNKNGHVYFTDIPESKIYKWTTADSLELYRENSNGANGLYFDQNQNLLACEGGKAQITLTTPEGKRSVVASEYNGKPFNTTNDIWPDAKGGAYFTDPRYGGDLENLPQEGMHVFYISPNKNSVIRVTDDLIKPNGLIGTPDGKILYITDPGAERTYSYNIEGDGTLSKKQLFVEYGGDGMTIDQQGNVYLTTSGQPQVDVFSPQGKLLKTITVPEQPSNVTFGGKDRNELYITARTSLYRVGLNREGVN
ncbi:SMP-30/gluconolactonase/LRE family protein [Psychroflexus lacisalsi]|jgi:gluconolactonase|uniref:SMP-30/gluconolactonase/LRE family protein n=1 Tax=Psychroflexus lacisalsi TaxID=503928 RepID=A0ABP3VJT9_9FLAO|nr:SMP-30/gluconolactonase/LRE family protein [Psychroflexus lacisalsi]MBZ9619568.1 SMP-30/gluconolactonase/LRE family protein [Psychroflexus lacisalsi]